MTIQELWHNPIIAKSLHPETIYANHKTINNMVEYSKARNLWWTIDNQGEIVYIPEADLITKPITKYGKDRYAFMLSSRWTYREGNAFP